MADVFISYSRKDKAFVERLRDALERKGTDVWVDWEDIPVTADWFARVQRGILESGAFVFVVSPDSVGSEVCLKEAAYAGEHRKRVIGLQLRDIGQATAPEPVAKVNWVPVPADDPDAAAEALRAALAIDLEWAEQHTRYLVDAERWDAAGRSSSLLLRGTELRAAERWLATPGAERKDPPPAPIHYEYIFAGKRGSSRRLQMLVGASLTALVVTAALAVLAITQRNEARDQRSSAESRELSSASLLNLSSDPELSVLLAERAAGVRGTDQARDALRESLLESRVRLSLRGHRDALLAMAVAPQGDVVVTGADDHTARVWDLRTGRLLHVLRGHELGILRIAWDPRGRRIATTATDYTIRIWDPRGGRLLQTIRDDRDYRIGDVAWSPDGRRIAVGAFTMTARIYEVASGRVLHDLRGQVFVDHVRWTRDGSRVLLGRQDGTVRLIDPDTGRQVGVFRGHPQPPASTYRSSRVTALELSPDGRTVASADEEGRVLLWTRSGRVLARLEGHRGQVGALAFSGDGSRLASASVDRTARVWSVRTRRAISVLSGHQDPLNAIAVSANGRRVVTGAEDETVRLWDARTGSSYATLRGHRGEIREVAFVPGDDRVISGSADGTARVWDAQTEPFPRAKAPDVGLATEATRKAVSGNGRWMALAFDDPEAPAVAVLDLRRGLATRRYALPPGAVPAAGISEDGTLVVTATPGVEGGAQIRRLADGAVVRDLGTRDVGPGYAAWAPDGRHVAVAQGFEVVVRETATGRVVGVYRHEGRDRIGGANDVHWDRAGERILSSGDDARVRLWSLAERRQVRSYPMTPLAPRATGSRTGFSPDGRYGLLAPIWDDEVFVVDLETGERISDLAGHASTIQDARFSPDGQFVITGSFDGTARLWEPVSGRTIAVLRPAAAPTSEIDRRAVSAVALTPDDREVIAVADGLHRYRCEICRPLPDLVALAEQRTTREFTPAERATYLHEQ